MTPRVLNKRTDTIPHDAVYVGRPTKWGNPFLIDSQTSRDAVVRKYRTYIESSLALQAYLHELRGKDLVCWCAPLACHADVLLELANKEPPAMTHYRYEIEGTGADGHRWSTRGLLDLASDRISDAVEAAHKDAFDKLTKGHAVYGQPGKGCKGPYQINKMMIEKVAG